MDAFSRDAVWLSMLQSFALLRSGDVAQQQVLDQAHGLLAYAHKHFADLRDPDNFNQVFSSDVDKPYRWPSTRTRIDDRDARFVRHACTIDLKWHCLLW